jgi:iron complex outermembrane recepter protein
VHLQQTNNDKKFFHNNCSLRSWGMTMKSTITCTKRNPLAQGIAIAFAVAASNLSMAAQDDNQTSDETRSVASMILEDVLVYGTKRSAAQAAQDVPAQVAAYGADQLAVRQVINIEDLSFATPNVQLDGVGSSPGVANFTIRGLGINSSIPSIDPTVGTFIDGIYAGVTYGVITDTFDLESVEIYKGPQGVLFGRNVTGGAVLLRSRRPTGEFGAKAKLGVETGLQTTGAFAVEGSLVEDTLAAKLSVYYKDDEGWFDNDTLNRKAGKDETQTERATLVYTPSDQTEFTFIYEHGRMDGDGAVPQAAQGASPSKPRDGFEVVAEDQGQTTIEWNQFTIEAGIEVGLGRITNIFGYRDVESFTLADIDAIEQQLFSVELGIDQRQFSNEIRYNVQPTEDWDLTVGAFYFEQNFLYTNARLHRDRAVRLLGGGDQDHSTWAVFANNDIAISDTFSVTAGLRYTKENKDVKIWARTECDYDTYTCPEKPRTGEEWKNLSPKLGAQWQVADDAELYAHWTRGYRSGGYNFRTPLANPVATDEEEQNSFEVGVKSTLADGRIRLNGAVFVNKISDMQRETNLPEPGGLGIIQDIANTADATIQGFEIDTLSLISDDLAITASVGYLDGKYDEILNDLNRDGVVDDVDKGLDLPRLSKWTANLGVTYDFHLGAQGILSARADYSYRSDAAYSDNNVGQFPSYDMVNAGLTYYPAEGDWTVSVYGKNLTDTVVFGNMTALPFPGDATYFAPMKKGRRYGAEFRYEF